MILVYIIGALLVIAGLVIVCRKVLSLAKLRALKPSIKNALNEFNALCNVNRLFTEQERHALEEKNLPLVRETNISLHSFWLQEKLSNDPEVKEFMSLFGTFNAMKTEMYNSNHIYNAIQEINSKLPVASSQYRSLIDKDDYFTHSEMEKYQQEWINFFLSLDLLKKKQHLDSLNNEKEARDLLSCWNELESKRMEHNRLFREKELKENKGFFDSKEVGSLSEQQRDSAVRLEDNCLVISSAGSGKTKTMVGKLHYLVKKRHLDPEKVLVLTYTRAAANELTDRLTSTLLQGRTFHSLALEIISQVSGHKPSIAPPDVFLNVFNNMMRDQNFLSAVVEYLEEYQSGVKAPSQYETAEEFLADRKKYGIQALYTDMDGNIIFTKSEEEKKICNYLTHMGLQFRYEEPYEYITSTPNYRQYNPDFTIHYVDANGIDRRLYLEHFAVGKDGTVPKWFGDGIKGGWYVANRIYNQGIEWKKSLHRDKGTTLIYTTSADFESLDVENKLRRLLEKAGVPLSIIPSEELYDKIAKRNKNIEKSVLEMCEGFVNLMKANRKTIDEVYRKAKANSSTRDAFIIMNMMKPLYEKYETVLVQRGEIDFTDAILQATDYCNNGHWKEYDYILVDEFQDISIDRYQFLQSLRRKDPLTKLYCVGDDWQSIYRFSGSDVNLFTKFSDYFGYTEECKLETTYRFGNPLIDKSSEFIQVNPEQKKKDVKPLLASSPDNNMMVEVNHTEIDSICYCKDQNIYSLLETYIKDIPQESSIYILGRYTYDVKCLGESKIKEDIRSGRIIVNFEDRKVPFLTVHSSKGLEADYVFLLNCNSGIYGFPSMISDDPILDYVLSEADHFPYGEERRVFYVGITRAKTHTYVLYEDDKPSLFVTEMFNKIAEIPEGELCPKCKSGRKVALKRGVTTTGNQYINWGCDNYSAGCDYFEREFINKN